MTLADEIEERWSRARVSDDGAVTVPGCADPREDVRTLLEALRASVPQPSEPEFVGAKPRRKRGESKHE